MAAEEAAVGLRWKQSAPSSCSCPSLMRTDYEVLKGVAVEAAVVEEAVALEAAMTVGILGLISTGGLISLEVQ